MSEVKERLSNLRAQMKRAKVDVYYVPSTDPHQSEYVPQCWQRRAWLSGFSGSAGDLVVTLRTAGLWTDGRYHLQAGKQLRGSGIKLFKAGNPNVPSIPAWLGKTLTRGQVLGADPRVLSRAAAADLQAAAHKAGARLKLVDRNLVDAIWQDRPGVPTGAIEVLPNRLVGLSPTQKLAALRRAMKEARADAHVLSALDAIAWLLNIRGQDVAHNPVVIAYLVVTAKGATLYTHPKKVTPEVRHRLGKACAFAPYGDVRAELAALGKAGKRVWVDGSTVNRWVLDLLKGADLHTDPSPVFRDKARKNAAEVRGIRAAMERDGVAMVRLLAWLEREVALGTRVTEWTVAQKAAELRAEGEGFRGTSFGTIVGYAQNGAIIHYEPEPESAAELRPEGLLLIDSGAQYQDGTTDLTRTVLLGGEATEAQKGWYTRVLKGHIALARLRFPEGTAGKQVDTLARLPLWEVGLNYAHGTGHGVGFFLGVHEGPQSISPWRCTGWALEEGNLLSNEPGYYEEGSCGIRIENLVLVEEDPELSGDGGVFLRFDTVTLCPIDTRPIDRKLLTQEERQWLNDYHTRVREALLPHLDRKDAAWLRKATRKV